MKRSIQSNQRKVVQYAFTVDMTASNALSGIDAQAVSVDTDNGTGDIDILLPEPLQNAVILVTPETADTVVQASVTSNTLVNITAFDSTDGTTAKDAKFHVLVVGSLIPDQYSVA